MYLIRCLLSQYQEWKNYTPIKALSIKPVVVFDHVGDQYAPATGIIELFERKKGRASAPCIAHHRRRHHRDFIDLRCS